MITRNTYTPNPFLHSVTKNPTYTSFEHQSKILHERTQRCVKDFTSRESAIFTTIFFKNVALKEYAHDCIREAIASIRQNKKLFRHAIKQKCNEISRMLARWDGSVGRTLCKETYNHLDFYDATVDKAKEFIASRYNAFYAAMLSVAMQNGCTETHITTEVECASMLIDLAAGQFAREYKEYLLECPPLETLEGFHSNEIAKAMDGLQELVCHATIPKGTIVNPNQDAATKKAADSLINYLTDDRMLFRDLWEKAIGDKGCLEKQYKL